MASTRSSIFFGDVCAVLQGLLYRVEKAQVEDVCVRAVGRLIDQPDVPPVSSVPLSLFLLLLRWLSLSRRTGRFQSCRRSPSRWRRCSAVAQQPPETSPCWCGFCTGPSASGAPRR
ncbi:unnamed protein product [Ectocarpus sp. 12 AP-2014]